MLVLLWRSLGCPGTIREANLQPWCREGPRRRWAPIRYKHGHHNTAGYKRASHHFATSIFRMPCGHFPILNKANLCSQWYFGNQTPVKSPIHFNGRWKTLLKALNHSPDVEVSVVLTGFYRPQVHQTTTDWPFGCACFHACVKNSQRAVLGTYYQCHFTRFCFRRATSPSHPLTP